MRKRILTGVVCTALSVVMMGTTMVGATELVGMDNTAKVVEKVAVEKKAIAKESTLPETAPGAVMNLAMNQTTTINTKGGYQYFMYKAPATGTVNISSTSGIYAWICNANKANLCANSSDYMYSTRTKVSFGVTKGVTYFVRTARLSTGYVSAYPSEYAFYASFSTVKDNGGKSKKKAKTMKRSKTYTGIVSASDKNSKVDWYKFKNTKKRKVKLYLTGYDPSSSIKVTFVNAKGRSFGYLSCSAYSAVRSGIPYNLSGQKLAKGTYYLKVAKNNSGNGKYSVRIK